ncbi:hypothetical protein RB195_012822 [Necator americanus]|uniref:Uncharacterized protein n=1 Tax=Necator americanus TaxID=51031 RepID=A0ABR1DSQ6_NECAM
MAEWSKAPDSSIHLSRDSDWAFWYSYGCVGSNPTPCKLLQMVTVKTDTMAEWSKAPDSSIHLLRDSDWAFWYSYGQRHGWPSGLRRQTQAYTCCETAIGRSGTRTGAWVQIPLRANILQMVSERTEARMAEWSKAPDSSIHLLRDSDWAFWYSYGCVGSNPTPCKLLQMVTVKTEARMAEWSKAPDSSIHLLRDSDWAFWYSYGCTEARMAEWSKAPDSSIHLLRDSDWAFWYSYGCVGSNPTPCKLLQMVTVKARMAEWSKAPDSSIHLSRDSDWAFWYSYGYVGSNPTPCKLLQMPHNNNIMKTLGL